MAADNLDRRHEPISIDGGRSAIKILAAINELHARFADNDEGQVASYIPELKRVDPECFGVSVVTCAGEVFSVGDTQIPFTLQSLVNPFMYATALEERGRARVEKSVGVEPSGNPFHEIVLDRETNRPMNPMINAGALAVSDLLPGADPTDRLNFMLKRLSTYVGHEMQVDMQVFSSERSTADRNRSIAYLMRHFKAFDRNLEENLDLYFQLQSVIVDSESLATMAATLANGGVNPLTHERAISKRSLRDVLTLMFTCGLYERTGLWAYRVGVPAKSGVGGGFIAVVPQVLGVGVFSPRLDDAGNSIRGMLVCQELIRGLRLHMFDKSPCESNAPGWEQESCAI